MIRKLLIVMIVAVILALALVACGGGGDDSGDEGDDAALTLTPPTRRPTETPPPTLGHPTAGSPPTAVQQALSATSPDGQAVAAGGDQNGAAESAGEGGPRPTSVNPAYQGEAQATWTPTFTNTPRPTNTPSITPTLPDTPTPLPISCASFNQYTLLSDAGAEGIIYQGEVPVVRWSLMPELTLYPAYLMQLFDPNGNEITNEFIEVNPDNLGEHLRSFADTVAVTRYQTFNPALGWGLFLPANLISAAQVMALQGEVLIMEYDGFPQELFEARGDNEARYSWKLLPINEVGDVVCFQINNEIRVRPGDRPTPTPTVTPLASLTPTPEPTATSAG
ncbi:MAG: hypothetical protein GYB65_05955 [Chloroflexi bacterium]|nr:hypothetical protein [Chloroflexota bacterium]